MTAADLARDPGLVVALQTARAWGVSPSMFFGAPAATSFVYDDVGRLLGSRTASPWTDEDRTLAYALAEHEAGLCSCGQPLEVSMDRAHEFAYVSQVAGRCHACTAQDVAGKPFEDSPSPHALRFRTHLDPVKAELGRARVAAEQEEASRADRGEDGAGAVGGAEPGAPGAG